MHFRHFLIIKRFAGFSGIVNRAVQGIKLI